MPRFHYGKEYGPLLDGKFNIAHLHGGRAAARSYTGSQYFIDLLTHPDHFRGFIIRKHHKDIKDSIFQDLIDRIEENETLDFSRFKINRGAVLEIFDKVTGNTIKSKGLRQSSSKAKANVKSLAGATHVLIEEAEEMDSETEFNRLWDSFRKVGVNVQCIMLFNPPEEDHWINKKWYTLEESGVKNFYNAKARDIQGFISIHCTYHSNVKHLNKATIANYERYKEEVRTQFYYHHQIQGLVPSGVTGRVYPIWGKVSEMPEYPSVYGLDFGYTNDPTALVQVMYHKEDLYLRELIYQTELTNKDLAGMIKDLLPMNSLIIADSAEPKSIAELNKYLRSTGIQVKGAIKGAGSVNKGIDKLKSLRIFVYKESTNIILENRKYQWLVDSEDKPTNQPKDDFNHAMDAIRYAERMIHNKNTIRRY